MSRPAYVKDPMDPAWKDGADLKTFLEFMNKFRGPDVDGATQELVSGWSAMTLSKPMLPLDGDDLITTANIMKQQRATSHQKISELPMLLPGIKGLERGRPPTTCPSKQMQRMRFDLGKTMRSASATCRAGTENAGSGSSEARSRHKIPSLTEFLSDPHPFHEGCVTSAIVHSPRYGVWAMARHAASASGACRTGRVFSSARGVGVDDFAKGKPWRPSSLLLRDRSAAATARAA